MKVLLADVESAVVLVGRDRGSWQSTSTPAPSTHTRSRRFSNRFTVERALDTSERAGAYL